MENKLSQNINGYIIKKFRLFENFRSQKEDENILEKVLETCLSKLLFDIGENTTAKDKREIEKHIENIEKSNFSQKEKIKMIIDLLILYSGKIKNLNHSYEKELILLVDELFEKSTS